MPFKFLKKFLRNRLHRMNHYTNTPEKKQPIRYKNARENVCRNKVGRLRVTLATNGKRQIQVENFSQ